MSKLSLSNKRKLPWLSHDFEQDGHDEKYCSYFQVRYKRRYILMMILFMLGMVWMGIGIFDEDMTEMFFAVTPLIIVPFIIRFFGVFPALVLAVLIPASLYFASPELAGFLGKIIVILMFFVFFPCLIFLWVFALFDQRPQLLIGAEGICCRQFSEELIPWEDITFVHVSTYERLWFLKVKNLIFSLRDFSCYSKPSSVWTPQYFLYGLTKLVKKPHDSASVHISGIVLDPSLPFVMKAIEYHRPQPKPKRSRTGKT